MVLNGKSSEEYPLNALVSQGSIFGPIFLVPVTLLMMLYVILLSMLMILISTLSVIAGI